MVFWVLAHHYVFLHLNAREDYYLFRKWMQITCELPANNEGDYRVPGMSRKEHRAFWSKERNFNYYWYRVVGWCLIVLCVLLSVQLFIVHFDIDWCTYVLAQSFAVFHLTYMVYYFLHQLYSINLFCLQITRFLSLKFKCIARRLVRLNKGLNVSRAKMINNRRLAKLIYSYNQVHLELIEANDFFKDFLGVNVIFFCIYALLVMFLVIFIGWILRVALFLIVLGMFLTTVLVPFSFANSLSTQVHSSK